MALILDGYKALGSAWWIEINEPTHGTVTLQEGIIASIARFEARYSRFRPDSLTSHLNRDGILRNPDPETIAFFSYGKELYTRTGGVFNCLLGSELVARGYGTGRAATATAAQPVPTSDLTVTPESITLTNGSFDPGGFGKGYLIDELATLLRDAQVEHFLINGGGDLFGTTLPGDQPFTIYLEHPTEANTYLGTTPLAHQGFAASSPFKRTWTHGGKTHSHIVGETRSASFVLASCARDADAFATACLLAAPEMLAFLATKNHLGVARYEPSIRVLTQHNLPFEAI